MSLEEQFERARNEESYRQVFLDQIDLEYVSKFVKKVIYEPKQRFGYGGIEKAEMACLPSFICAFGLILRIPHMQSTIRVYPATFEDHTLKEFQNTLIDHEGFHAIQNFINPWRSHGAMEQEAYLNQITRARNRGLSEEWIANITFASLLYKALL